MAAHPDREHGTAPPPPPRDAPPFLSWGAIYAIVAGALALQIAVYGVLTWVFQ